MQRLCQRQQTPVPPPLRNLCSALQLAFVRLGIFLPWLIWPNLINRKWSRGGERDVSIRYCCPEAEPAPIVKKWQSFREPLWLTGIWNIFQDSLLSLSFLSPTSVNIWKKHERALNHRRQIMVRINILFASKLKNTLVDSNSFRQELDIYCNQGLLWFIMFINQLNTTFLLKWVFNLE